MSLQLADIAPDFTSETTAAKDWRHFIGSMSLIGENNGGLVRSVRRHEVSRINVGCLR